MLQLRDYQKDCVKKIIELLPTNDDILIQAATGAGKTIIFSALVKQLIELWPNLKICIAVHLKEIVEQNIEKLKMIWPDAPIGVSCSSSNFDIDLTQQITIGSIQTIANKLDKLQTFNLIIVDEAHKIPPTNQDGQYLKLFNFIREKNNKLKIIGFTATPYRLGHGYIYGDNKKISNDNLFKKLNYSIGIKQLQKQNYLCGHKIKFANNMQEQLKNIKVNGDYNISELEHVMVKEINIKAVYNAIIDYADDRKNIIIFCTTIKHAELINNYLNEKNISSEVIHSKMKMQNRNKILNNFTKEKNRVLCNVGIATEGYDNPKIDCVILDRPTKSTSLYVQMCGRGLRPYDNKDYLLILDLVNNCYLNHGDISNPNVVIPLFKSDKDADAVVKICDKCFSIIAVGYKKCPDCGYEFPILETNKEISEDRLELQDYNELIKDKGIVVDVINCSLNKHISMANNSMILIKLICSSEYINKYHINYFVDIEGNASKIGKFNAINFFNGVIRVFPYPKTINEVLQMKKYIIKNIPKQITIIKKNNWWTVKKWRI